MQPAPLMNHLKSDPNGMSIERSVTVDGALVWHVTKAAPQASGNERTIPQSLRYVGRLHHSMWKNRFQIALDKIPKLNSAFTKYSALPRTIPENELAMPMLSSTIVFRQRAFHICIYVHTYEELFS